jgi:hypothetical protein
MISTMPSFSIVSRIDRPRLDEGANNLIRGLGLLVVCLDPESDEHDSSLRKEKSPSLAGQSNMDEGDDLV